MSSLKQIPTGGHIGPHPTITAKGTLKLIYGQHDAFIEPNEKQKRGISFEKENKLIKGHSGI